MTSFHDDQIRTLTQVAAAKAQQTLQVIDATTGILTAIRDRL
jgi:hypothetical protein